MLAAQAQGATVADHRGARRRRRHDAPDAGGVQGMPRPAMRLLHAGHGDERDRPRAAASEAPTRRRSARSSKATCAAAPATTTSSRRCSRAPPRWRSRRTTHGCERQRLHRPVGQAQGGRALPHRRRAVHRRRRRCRTRRTRISCARRTRTRRSATIDTAKAKTAPGVVAIYTGADLEGVNGLPCGWLITEHRRQADEGAAASRAGARARCATSAIRSRW